MDSRVAYYFAAFAIILTYNSIPHVKGEPPVQICENGDPHMTIVTELQQLCAKAIRQQQNEQVQSIHKLLNASFQQMKNLNESLQQMKNQQETIIATSLQVFDRRSQEQVQRIYEFLNASLQQMKSKQETVMTSLQTVDRRSQEQDIYIKQVQSIHELLNTSFQQIKSRQDTVMTSLQAVDRRSQEQDTYSKQVEIYKFLNKSFEQMMTQHDTVLRSLEAIDHRLDKHDISIKNKTQHSWKPEIAVGIDLVEVPILLSTANDWIMIMNRFDGSLNFNRTWTEYKNGFGEIGRGEFWLGNEKIHRLTKRFVYILHIEVQLNSTRRWYNADYATFSIDSECNKYAIHLSGFSGDAGDSLTSSSNGNLDGMSFTTWDADNDRRSSDNCARLYQGGWWFNSCYQACLTCHYNNAFYWHSLRQLASDGYGLLRAARMMIKST